MAIFDSSPHSTFRVLDDKISSASQGVWWQGFDDAETQRLIAAANRAVEDEAREAAYGAVLRRTRENPPWLYLWRLPSFFGLSKKLSYEFRADNYLEPYLITYK